MDSLGPCVVPAVVPGSCVVLAPDLGVVVPSVVGSWPAVVVSCSPVAVVIAETEESGSYHYFVANDCSWLFHWIY